MSDTTKASDPRAERLKAALRDNLRRRKAQIRGRAGQGPSPETSEDREPPQDRRPSKDDPA